MSSVPVFPHVPSLQTYQGDLSQLARDRRVCEAVNFQGFVFSREVNFTGVTFEKGVVFQRCIFLEPVNFQGARFRGQGKFWKTIFAKKADFTCAVFEKGEGEAQGSNNSGEANFSWCQFRQDAYFYGTDFLGPVYCWRTIFQQYAKLEAHFCESVDFEGNQALLCFERSDFGNKHSLFDAMNRGGLLRKDEEDIGCAIVSWPVDDDAFTALLARVGLHPSSIGDVKAVLAPQRANMFSEKEASFSGSYFAKPEIAMFRNLDLKTCRFVNCWLRAI